MIILNFSHPLTAEHLQQIEALLDQSISQVIEIKTQVDLQQPLIPQVVALADACGLSSAEWQTLPLFVNLPGLSIVAACLLAELHGRMGYFPPCIRLRPVQGSLPPRYEVAEVLNPQAVSALAYHRQRQDTD